MSKSGQYFQEEWIRTTWKFGAKGFFMFGGLISWSFMGPFSFLFRNHIFFLWWIMSLNGLNPLQVQLVMPWWFWNFFNGRIGTLSAIIRNEGIHFSNKLFNSLLSKYREKNKDSLSYYSLANGQVQVSNREIKWTFKKAVNIN